MTLRITIMLLSITAFTPLAYSQGLVTVVSKGEVFECTPTHIWDGDGPIWCEEGPRIRLSGIAAREKDETCREGHPCPESSAIAATDALVNLVGTKTGTGSRGHILVKGPKMQCLSVGGAGGNRTAAWCVSPKGGDLSCQMLKSSTALKWPKYWGEYKCPAN